MDAEMVLRKQRFGFPRTWRDHRNTEGFNKRGREVYLVNKTISFI